MTCLTARWLSDSGPALDCTEVVTADGVELLIRDPDGAVTDTVYVPAQYLDEDDLARIATAGNSAGPVRSRHEPASASQGARPPAGLGRIPLPRVPGRPVRA